MSGIKSILNTITNVFNKTKTPLEPLPPQILLLGGLNRSGLSSEEMASEIIARQSEAGAPFGNIFGDSNNVSEAMELIRCQVIIDYLLTNAKVEIVIPAGVPVVAYGANAGGAIVVNGTTINTASGYGVIR